MKKLLLSIALIGWSGWSFAQSEMIVTPDRNPDNINVVRMDESYDASQSTYARGGSLWSEDFSGGWPAGWVADDVSGINPWKWSMEGSYGFWNGTNSNGADAGAAIASTTGADGFLINDPDSANHHAYGQPSGSTYQYLESWVATPAITLSGTDPSLVLEFEQYFRFNNTVDMIVQASNDSVNWVEYNVTGGLANNTGSDNPTLVELNISAVAANQTTVYLRFGWSARVYFWMIDDIRIVPGLNNDMKIDRAYHGDIELDFEYTKIPLDQAAEVIIGGVVSNQGGFTQPNVSLDYEIFQNGSSVSSGTAPMSASLPAGSSDTVWFNTGYTPDALGDYTVDFMVVSDSTDEDNSNNVISSAFEMTSYTYAHDEDDNLTLQVNGGDDANGDANEYKIGMYYGIINDADLTSITVAFGSNTQSNIAIIAEVFNATDLDNPIETQIYDVQAGDISTGGTPTPTEIVFDSPVTLVAGEYYFISVGTGGVGDDMWILVSDGNADAAQLRYGPFGVNNAIDWYTGYSNSPYIRMNFDPSVGIEDLSEIVELGMYPNPTAESVRLNLEDIEGDVQLDVISADGSLVISKTLQVANGSSGFDLNVSELSSGLYNVRVISDDTTFAGQLNVMH